MIGQTVSHYRIEEKLGEGGMGVVYRAEDTRLGRQVALKALAPAYARDPNRRKRFQHEARAAARLNHPGIAAVYEMEEVGEDLYIVYEYVRGENLRAVVNRGGVKLETVLDIASDVAAALAAAHAQGVVHRDLKPENIARTPGGDTKILDFGLARFQPERLEGETASHLTDAGAIVGTVAYMSPEQLEGKELDFRTDIFSFGVLLYELATGVRPFEGGSPASTIARILTGEPVPMRERNPITPAELDRIVRKCLRKSPDERYQSTRDLQVDLENLRRETSGGARRSEATVEEAGLLQSALSSFRLSPRRWWEVNQLEYVLFNVVMIYIGWKVKEWVGGSWGLALFLGVVVCAAASTSLRVILLSTAAVTPRNLPAEIRRVGPWARVVDLTFTGLLFVLAGSIVGTHPGWAALLMGFGVAGLVAFLIFEPALVRAAFPPPEVPFIVAPAPMAGRPRRWPLALGLVAVPALVVLGVAVGLNVGGWRERLFGTGAPRIESIAVLPLENLSRDPEQDYFADGMTEALISDLAQIRALRVISRTSVMQYKGARKPLPEIARELNVDAVVEGSVQRAGDRVRITAQLIHAPTDKHLWAQSYERDLRDVLALQGEVAQEIAREIKIAVTPAEATRLAKARRANPEAHEAYLKGRYYWNKKSEQGLNKGIEFFQQAIDLDPAYAPAYAGLADAYNTLANRGYISPKDGWPKARAAARRALALDDSLGEAHASLAFGAFYYDWDWAGAETECRRAVELNPNYATVHHWYSHYLIAMGREAESLAESQRALELDPLDLSIVIHLGWHYYMVRRYDPTLRQLQAALEMDPNFPLAHIHLGFYYEQTGKFDQAIAAFQKAINLAPGSTEPLAGLGHAYAVAGRRADARKVLEQLQEFSKQRYVSAFDIAVIYAGLGDKEQAFAWLDKAYEEHASGFSGLVYLAVEPRLDPLRADPRFQALLRRMNFPD